MLPTIESLQYILSCASSFLSPNSSMSSFTHFIHVFLFPPFPTPPTTSKRRHSETQSSAPLRSTCPNHLSLPRLTTLSTLSIPKPILRSLVLLLSFSVTPDIHLTMLFSVLTSLHIILLHRPRFATIHKHPLYTRSIYLSLHSQ